MMSFKKFCAQSALGMLFVSRLVSANDMTPIDQATWQFHQVRGLCVLEHKVAELAEARFSSPVAGELSFALHWLNTGAQGRSPQGGSAALNSRGTPWRVVAPQRLAQGDWQQQVLRFNGAGEAALKVLVSGLWLDITELGGARQLVLPSVNFQQAYQDFRLCRGTSVLEPSADGTQVTLHFQSGAKQLTANQVQQLKQLAQQVSTNSRITRLQIDAYTDNSGGPELNLRMSRIRALQVVEQLRRSLTTLPIDLRAHGQALPVSDNATAAGRYQNRRVTITLLQMEHTS